jgi:hypothetical protein
MYQADSNTEGKLQWVYSELGASPAVTIASDNDTDSTEELDGDYDSEHDSNVDMRMEDDVDALDSVDLDDDVDMERDGDDQGKEDEVNEDKGKEEEEEEDQGEKKDEDEDDDKEPQTIGPGEMVNTSADDVHPMGGDQPIVLPEQGRDMCEHTLQPQHPAASPQPQTAKYCP